jgi:hypothetical protein
MESFTHNFKYQYLNLNTSGKVRLTEKGNELKYGANCLYNEPFLRRSES